MVSSTNNFSFTSATFDYTLSHNPTDGSTMHVTETLVAEFPNFNQNHGIERYIPYTNKNGTNLTVKSQDALNLKVTRNESVEPFTLQKDGKSYFARIGNASKYVTGEQIYVLDYDFTSVITDYDNTNTQELYWDTNGTGWSQSFAELTANIHLPSDAKVVGTSCYVGRYGTKGSDRCTTTKTTDGYSFSTENLSAGENLTFDLEFPDGTFYIPPKPDSYLAVGIFAVEVIVFALISFLIYNFTWKKVRDNFRWYKNTPVPPEYTPLKGYSVGELAAVSLEKVYEPKVATLLELAVSKKISLNKGEKKTFSSKYDWTITINSLDDLTNEQLSLLKLFNDGHSPVVGIAYEVKKQSYSSALETAYHEYDTFRTTSLENKGDFVEPTSSKTAKKKSSSVPVTLLVALASFIIIGLVITFITQSFESILDLLEDGFNTDYYNVVAPWLIPIIFIFPVIALALHVSTISKLSRYKKYTREGLEHANYLRGLKLYIEMAEADRLKFLQSVDGADTSKQGIVKLYEKLLPYAALFGLEQSWLSEMEHYYEDPELTRPDWYDVGLTHALSSNVFASNFSRPIDPSSTSSSGSSGGGGGGSSGGGGGGGGGGGW